MVSTIYLATKKEVGQKTHYSNFFKLIPKDKIIRQDFQGQQHQPGKTSKGEIECKRVLENYFNKPFDKERPGFLNNPVTGSKHNLELDCFNKELGLAVEYSGRQHYHYVPFFHKNKEVFYNQKYRDELKRRMCKDNGVVLIEVPYTVKHKNIETFLKKELYNRGY